jgi:hypothetical protein
MNTFSEELCLHIKSLTSFLNWLNWLLFQGTFPGFLPWIERHFPEKQFMLVANIPYREMTLRSSQGVNMMSHLEDGMILMTAKN